MKAIFLGLMFIMVLGQTSRAQSADEKYIRQILANQVSFWNKNDIPNFMKGYWNNDSVLFIGKSGPKYGYETTLKNYQKNYPNDAAMGVLSFDLLELNRLSTIYSFVVGKFHLESTIGNAEGYFTLLFKKIRGKWFIVVDHSS